MGRRGEMTVSSASSAPSPPVRRRPTIADVAQLAGVSKAAVSFALNGESGVSEDTRAKIVAAADTIGFRPNRAARSLRQARTEVVGLVLNRPMRTLGVEPFFGQFSAGLSAELARLGHSLQTFTVHSAAAELDVYRRWWREQRVDALVVMDPLPRDRRISLVRELAIPAVVIGEPSVARGLSHVWGDDARGMEQCVDHLIQLGHQRIGHVGGTPAYAHTKRRSEVLAAAVREHRLETVVSRATDFSDTAASDATRQLLALPAHQAVTAIVFDSDVMALAGLSALLEAGIEVPNQMSLLSFDDSLLTRLTHPSLTALARDTFEFGVTVGQAVFDTLTRPGEVISREAPRPTLVVRESTSQCRAQGRAPRIGLTGGIASGKSTVAELLAHRGALVIDADQLAREVVAPGTAGFDEVVAAFSSEQNGGDIVAADGTLDRTRLAAIVFADPQARARLEGIIHPRVRAAAAKLRAEAGRDRVVVEMIPLLVETGQQALFDRLIVVDLPEDVQVARLMARSQLTAHQAQQRLAAQVDRATRLAVATDVIDNSGTLSDLEPQIERLWRSLSAQRI